MSEPCKHPNCRNMALVVIPKCEFCSERFCTTHLLPEVHGCGDACKNNAQRQATADASNQRRARKHLGNEDAKKRLDERLASNEEARRKKQPKGKK